MVPGALHSNEQSMEFILNQMKILQAENYRQGVCIKIVATLLLFLSSFMFMGFVSQEKEHLNLKSISIVDDKGTIRYRLGSIENDHGAVFYDADGKKRIFQGLFADGSARIRIFDEQETPRLSSGVFRTDNKEAAGLAATTYYAKDGQAKMTLGVDTTASTQEEFNNGFISIFAANNKRKMFFGESNDASLIALSNGGAFNNIVLATNQDHAALTLNDNNGKGRSELVWKGDYSRLGFFNKDEQIVSNYYASSSKAILAHYNSSGYAKIAMTDRSYGGSAFENFDNAGNHTVLMGMGDDGSVLNYARKTPGQEMEQVISWGSTAYGVLQALSSDKK